MTPVFRIGFAAALATMSPLGVPAFAAPDATAAAVTEDARLTAFLDAEFAQELTMRPQLATRLGMKEGADRFDDNSDAGALKMLEWRRGSVARMKAQFDRAKLSAEGQVNYDIWALELDRAELAYKFRRYRPPFYSTLYSVHAQLPDFLINTHSVADATDLKTYAARLRAIPGVLDIALAQMRESGTMGVHTPKFQIERIIAGSRDIIGGAPFSEGKPSALWADAQAKAAKLVASGKVTQAEADALLADVRTSLLSIRPAYERVIAWAESERATAPVGKAGAVTLPNGLDYYAAALKLNTTTDLTAEQIHAIGLKEVSRIEAEQDALARQAGLKDRQAYYAAREKQFPPVPWNDVNRAEYLKASNDFIAKTRTLLPNWFGALPAYKMEVIREPSFSEVPGGAAHAAPPSPDGTRPGRTWVHLAGVTDDPAAMYTLMCHEAMPGHVTQGDIQVRQSGGPKFRKSYGYVAFSEGWALYAEALCKEMGAYPDIAADFFRLDAELFRAARLVVDTGIHAKGWSEDQAIAYMIETGQQPTDKARSEVRRYITLPGQATGYKIGMLKIEDLRARAERELGPKFDIKGFHDLLIASGSQPLSILERRVDDWIAARKA
ncbi:DUF885 domain-containing protein [Sandaracinobacteroides hominis]|uniref:DUF885 domain-containing protein n=1 Tax=Sandaracinobacteroides hominis TaxID=2780086 RepID=UPI0018F50425|nr:DUF885 domain-containing protein [Sandaracinobacteroides hominis]